MIRNNFFQNTPWNVVVNSFQNFIFKDDSQQYTPKIQEFTVVNSFQNFIFKDDSQLILL